jgi:hypothetical protein
LFFLRHWYELLQGGHTLEEVRQLIGYLQREIRPGRRNVGAHKLSDLLQLDRFEEDVQIRRVRLDLPRPFASIARNLPAKRLTPGEQERGRQYALEKLRKIKDSLRMAFVLAVVLRIILHFLPTKSLKFHLLSHELIFQ